MATETESKTGTRFTEPRPGVRPGTIDTESGLNATDVLDRLRNAGHDHTPDKQAVRLDLAGKKVTLYRADDGRSVLLNAEQTDYYVEKGAFAPEKPTAAEIRKYRREHGLEDVHLPGVDNDEQPGDQVDPADKFSEPRTATTRRAKKESTPAAAQKVEVVPPAPAGVTTSADATEKE